MKKKILLSLIITFVLLFTSGCTVDYTLKYENDIFTEILNVTGEEEDDAHPTYNDIKENGLYADVDGKEYFTLEDESTNFDVKLTHELKNVKLNRLNAVTECFSLNTYTETDDSYYIALYGDFTCSNLTNSTFTLETDATVSINNAHKIEENKYIWNLNEDEVAEDGIKFQVIKPEVEKVTLKSDTMIPTWGKIVIVIIIIGVGFILLKLLKKAGDA